MGIVKIAPHIVPYAKLIAALMSSDLTLMEEVEQQLATKFGDYDLKSKVFSFDDFSHYYAPEMGEGLQKRFVSFAAMIRLEELAKVKNFTNDLEQQYVIGGKRQINVDPGYLTHAQMVLATTKDYSHRIYLGQGIHAELTYIISKKTFRSLEWTYPDYRKAWAIEFFGKVRQKYLRQMREKSV